MLSMMRIIRKPARVTKKTATAIDHIFINSITISNLKQNYKIGYFKNSLWHNLSDISLEKLKYKLWTVNYSDTKKAL